MVILPNQIKPDHKKNKMNKDKLQVGDLVCSRPYDRAGREHYGIGLVTGINYLFAEVYWFKLGRIGEFCFRYLSKLEIPNE
tara:strand:+ start:1134 stop:1376 length:243 start_codon:yes stop_codon:yes gene_type:complete